MLYYMIFKNRVEMRFDWYIGMAENNKFKLKVNTTLNENSIREQYNYLGSVCGTLETYFAVYRIV